MQENKKDTVQNGAQKTKKEQKEALQKELLAEAFNACMEEQMSFIPPEREIARMHTFSDEFQASMEELCRTKGKIRKQEATRREFVFGFNRIAACILLMLVVGGVCVGGYLISERGIGGSSTGSTAEYSTEGSTEETVAEPAEQAADTALPEEEQTDQTAAGTDLAEAEEQMLPSESDGIRMLISSPVVDRDMETVKVTFGNLTEETVSYSRDLELQVCIDGVWYVVPKLHTEQEEAEEQDAQTQPGTAEVKLEAGMAQDEEIQLSEYRLDYEAEKYRVVSRIDGRLFGSEFRFETLEEGLEEALDGSLDSSEQ